jgi:hypothetical protein
LCRRRNGSTEAVGVRLLRKLVDQGRGCMVRNIVHCQQILDHPILGHDQIFLLDYFRMLIFEPDYFKLESFQI